MLNVTLLAQFATLQLSVILALLDTIAARLLLTASHVLMTAILAIPQLSFV